MSWSPPAFVAVAVTTGFAWFRGTVLERAGGLDPAVSTARHELVGPLVLGLLVLVVVGERLGRPFGAPSWPWCWPCCSCASDPGSCS